MKIRGKVVITGGFGFIGSCAAEHFLKKGCTVLVIDDLSRKGSDANQAALSGKYPGLESLICDIASTEFDHFEWPSDVGLVLHLAGQVAVTSSVLDPTRDFMSNAVGTIKLLEKIRLSDGNPVVIYSSTNKVYGSLANRDIQEKADRYEFGSGFLGVAEDEHLSFSTPYGCSKGCADQYVIDYNKIYGLRTCVLRQSCIYGDGQLGVEDQGWISWFVIALTLGKDVTVFGDGKQVRDILHVSDLISCFEAVYANYDRIGLPVFNIGGGPDCAVSVREVIGLISKYLDQDVDLRFDRWRPDDQRVYISDVSKAHKELSWSPTTSPENGIENLVKWASANNDKLAELFSGGDL